MHMNITQEQQQIIETPLENFKVMKIIAFAGTGKSTTLREYARRYSDNKFLYLVFNKAAAEEAKGKFPRNCDCMTIHSLAFKKQREWIEKKKAGFSQHLRGSLSFEYLKKITGIEDKVVARIVSETVSGFCHVPDLQLGVEHVPPETIARLNRRIKSKSPDALQEAIKLVISSAQHLLETCLSEAPGEFTYDIYLKRQLLVGLSISNYDAIMLDEAQDSDPVTVELLKKSGNRLILVGDPHQQIYAFRKAINAMASFNADCEYSLTGSFRFGQEIAEKANLVLSNFKNENRKINGLASEKAMNVKGTTCYLARTNIGLFKKLISLGNTQYRIQGGVDSTEFNKILDTYYLWSEKRELITSEEVLDFPSFQDLKVFGEETGDIVIERYCSFIEEYKNDIPAIINRIKASINNQNTNANIVVSTCHKSKGNEYEHVILLDDFKLPLKKVNDEFERCNISDDEINILYVAITRAKYSLEIPFDTLQVFDYLAQSPDVISGESFSREKHEIGNNSDTFDSKVENITGERNIQRRLDCKHGVSIPVQKTDVQSEIQALGRIASSRFFDGSLGTEKWTKEDESYYYIMYLDEGEDTLTFIENDPDHKINGDWSDSFDDFDSEDWEMYYDPGIEITDR